MRRRIRIGVATLALAGVPAVLMAQRGPEPQQGTGQNNPDMEHGPTPGSKPAEPNPSGLPREQGTGQNNPDTQQQKHHTGGKKKHKKQSEPHEPAKPTPK